ncbi:MAG: thiamine pyrophosphate-binding protein, partial [candidate division NC10 bacterium]
MPLAGSLVFSLAVQGAGVTFGLPGLRTVPPYGALVRRRCYVPSATSRAHPLMAGRYARPTGRLGVVPTPTGPALPNAPTGRATACLEPGFI